MFAVLGTAAAALAPPAAALERLGRNGPGYAVVENFLSPAHIGMLKQDVSALNGESRFNVAGVGDASTNRVADDVRRCEQCFIYPRVKYSGGGHPEARSVLPLLTKRLDELREAVRPHGGSVNALVCAGPMLHCCQNKDLSCSYRCF